MFTLIFLKATLERAVKTAAQSAIGVLTVGQFGLLEVDWAGVGSVAGLAAIVSVLTSVATGAITDGSPSAVNAEKLAPESTTPAHRA